jgi:hypothetical protein
MIAKITLAYNNEAEGGARQDPRNNTSTSIAIDSSNESRLGIIAVMFTLDKSILSWAAGTFYDGKLETIDDVNSQGNQKVVLVPNSDKYCCQYIYKNEDGTTRVCGETRTKSDWDWAVCKGTKEKPHKAEYREAVEWYPLVSRTGISFLLSQLQMGINPNIQTANFGKNINDVKNKADLDSKLTNLAVNQAISIVGALLSNRNNYADWLLKDPHYNILPQVFNVPFLTSTMTALASNLLASYTKGKNMEAVGKVLETRTRIEQEITNKSERSAQEQQITQNNSRNNSWGIFDALRQHR